MLWNYMRFQKLIDALFDDGWGSLGLPEAGYAAELQATELLQVQSPSTNNG